MTPQTDFLELLCKTIEDNVSLTHSISLKEIKAEGGIYAELGEGFADSQYFDKSTILTMPVLFMCRDSDQKQGLEQLIKICNYLQRLKEYPSGNSFGWIDAAIAKQPSKIGRDEDGVYHFSCMINCRIYF